MVAVRVEWIELVHDLNGDEIEERAISRHWTHGLLGHLKLWLVHRVDGLAEEGHVHRADGLAEEGHVFDGSESPALLALIRAISGDVILLSAVPACAVIAGHCWMRTFELGVRLAAVSAAARPALAVAENGTGLVSDPGSAVVTTVTSPVALIAIAAAVIPPVALIAIAAAVISTVTLISTRALTLTLVAVHDGDQILERVDDVWAVVLVLVLVLGVVHDVDAPAPPIEQDSRRLRDHHVAELDVALLARGVPKEVFSESGWENREEVRFHLLVLVEAGAACLLVLLELSLKFRDSGGHGVQILNGPRMEETYFSSQLLELQRQSIIDDPHHAPPSVQAVEHFGLLEHGFRRAGQALRQETPYGGVEELLLGLVHLVVDDLAEALLCDDGLVVELGPA